jgi:hypothetical protein
MMTLPGLAFFYAGMVRKKKCSRDNGAKPRLHGVGTVDLGVLSKAGDATIAAAAMSARRKRACVMSSPPISFADFF